MVSLSISRDDLTTLLEHAASTLPNESVALLFGHIQDDIAIVEKVSLVHNTAASPIRFEVDPVVEYNLLMEAEKCGQHLIGIFHSHPAPPRPSTTDIMNMRFNPVIWLIAGRLAGEWRLGCFVMGDDGLVTEVQLTVIS
ncbi:MAG: M67 family metallopeptidase [Candidatus Thorarchaeota archaeon]